MDTDIQGKVLWTVLFNYYYGPLGRLCNVYISELVWICEAK